MTRLRGVLALAWPILVSMISYSLMGAVDTAFVSHLGTASLAGVGLATGALHLCSALWVGALSAVRVLVAQRVGAGDFGEARAYAWHGLGFALLAGGLTASLAPAASALLAALGATPEVGAAGAGYLEIRLAGSVLVFLVLALHGWFQGRGDTRTPMRATLVGNALNLALDPVLIFGLGGAPALGEAGAAIATVIAWGAQLVLLGLSAGLRLGAPPRPQLARLRRLLGVGLPIGVHYTLDVAAYALFASVLATIGDAHVAAHALAVRVSMLGVMPGHAVAEATSVRVGNALGAGEPDAAREAWASGTVVACALMGLIGVGLVLAPRALLLPFGADPDVTELAVAVLTLFGAVQILDAVGMVAIGALNGAGDTRFSMAAGLGVAWLVKVPVGLLAVFAFDLGVLGAWVGISAELAVLAAVAVARIRGAAWLAHTRRVVAG